MMLDPDPTSYGLRQFLREDKSFWVAEEHSDETVIHYLGASLGELTDLAYYVGPPGDIQKAYEELDQMYQEVGSNEQARQTVTGLLVECGLFNQMLIHLSIAGHKILSSFTSEELQKKYCQGLRHKDEAEILGRFEAYSQECHGQMLNG